ncbi:signal peptidase II, partial [Francisella tularensis]
IGNYLWPSFNIADSAITCGVVFLIAASLFTKKKS